MAVDRFQLSGLVRPDPVHVALYGIEIGVHLGRSQPAYAGRRSLDMDHHATTGLLLVAGRVINNAAVNLYSLGNRRDAS